jgi:hypothetical protein
VQVDGSAAVGGTLAVSSLNNFRPAGGNVFEVIRSNRTRSGQFAQINDSLNINPNLQLIDVYAPNAVALIYVPVGLGPTPTPVPTPAPVPPLGPTPTPVPTPPPVQEVIPDPLPPVDPNRPLNLLSFLLKVLDPTARNS